MTDPHPSVSFPAQGPSQLVSNHGRCDEQWRRFVHELESLGAEAAERDFAIDEMLLARFLAGECTPEERDAVQQAIQKDPRIRECVEAVRAAIGL